MTPSNGVQQGEDWTEWLGAQAAALLACHTQLSVWPDVTGRRCLVEVIPESRRRATAGCLRNVVIPRQGQTGAARQQVEHGRTFRRTVKWRTGGEGRISTLKPGYGCGPHPPGQPRRSQNLDRTGVFTHNLVKIADLTA